MPQIQAVVVAVSVISNRIVFAFYGLSAVLQLQLKMLISLFRIHFQTFLFVSLLKFKRKIVFVIDQTQGKKSKVGSFLSGFIIMTSRLQVSFGSSSSFSASTSSSFWVSNSCHAKLVSDEIHFVTKSMHGGPRNYSSWSKWSRSVLLSFPFFPLLQIEVQLKRGKSHFLEMYGYFCPRRTIILLWHNYPADATHTLEMVKLRNNFLL